MQQKYSQYEAMYDKDNVLGVKTYHDDDGCYEGKEGPRDEASCCKRFVFDKKEDARDDFDTHKETIIGSSSLLDRGASSFDPPAAAQAPQSPHAPVAGTPGSSSIASRRNCSR